MKKFFNVLVATSILICGFVFTGCNAAAMLGSTTNQWYSYARTVDIPLGITGDEDDAVSTLKDANIYFYFDEEEGLTVAVQAETEESVDILGGLLSQKVDITAGASYQFENFNSATWLTLVALSGCCKCDEPKVVSDPEECLILGGENAKETKVVWKKVLAEIIMNKLLGE